MAGTALKNCFKEIADAIREKLRINTPMTPLEMPSYIDLIETREVNRSICDLQKVYEKDYSGRVCVLNRLTPIIDYENDRIFFWDPGQGLYLYIFTENSVKFVLVGLPIKGITPADPKQVFLANDTLYFIPKNEEEFIFIDEDLETGDKTYYLYYYTVKLPKDIPTYWDGAEYAYDPLWSEHRSQWAYELQPRQSYYSVPGSQYSTQWRNNCFINNSNNYAYFLMTSFRYNANHEEVYDSNGIKIPLSSSYTGLAMFSNISIEEGIDIYKCINGYNIYLNIYNQEPVFCYPNNTLLKLDVTNDIYIYTLTSFENLRDYNNNSYNPGIISEYIDNNNTKYTIKLDNCLNKLINNMWYVDMILPVFKKEYPYFMISSSDADVVLEDNFYQGNHMPSSSDISTIRRLYHFKNAGTFCFITTKYWNKYKWLQDLIIYKIIDKEEV